MNNILLEKRINTAARLGIKPEQVPEHIAIIMDGNGRWAQNKKMPRIEGHRKGGKVVEKTALYGVELGIEYLTLYTFSVENWKRPREEVDALMYLYTHYLVGIRAMMMKNNVKLVHLGSKEGLPEELKKEMAKSIEMTCGNTGMVLGLALNYGSRNEILDAVKSIAVKCRDGELSPDEIDQKYFSSQLSTAGFKDPDLLIRTSDEKRISNFLLWQISYSEFYTTPVCWPDFGEKDMDEAIIAYSRRNRRFGDITSE